jgi:hypothetical protein
LQIILPPGLWLQDEGLRFLCSKAEIINKLATTHCTALSSTHQHTGSEAALQHQRHSKHIICLFPPGLWLHDEGLRFLCSKAEIIDELETTLCTALSSTHQLAG